MIEFLLSGLRSGLRGRSFHAVLLLGLALIGIAYLSASFSPRQPGTVALDVGLSGMRFTLVLLCLFWIQDLLAREIDRKTILFSLAYPCSRAAYLGGRYLAVVALVVLAAAALSLCLLLAVVLAGGRYEQNFPVGLGVPYAMTIVGLILDVAVVAAVALCVTTVSTVSLMPLAVGAAFAIAGKALGATLDFFARGADGDADMIARLGPAVSLVEWLVPDLSRLDWREWPMYGLVPDASALAWSAAMAIAYIVVALLVAVMVFARREFS